MKIYTDRDIESFEKYFRIKFVNGITGFKSANLIGTKSRDGIENLAVFSSVVHIGSHPPYLGFITRPITVPRNTYENIKSTGVFTVNAISVGIAEQAHSTSAKYSKDVSEFEKCNFSSSYTEGFHAPFVENTPLGIGCEFVE
jgi:flavin reductase (DIM6/NTAB) family NADH-FMN oxidoreductase RutF